MNTGDKVVLLESYYNPMLAHIILGKLKYNDLPCFISDENILWAKPYYNQLLGGVKIWVFEKDLARCREIMGDEAAPANQGHLRNDEEPNTTAICPYCGSADTRYGVAVEFRFHLPSVLISVFLGFPFYFRTSWHCFNCYRDFEIQAGDRNFHNKIRLAD